VYPFNDLKSEGVVPHLCELRQVKYLSNVIEQEHRFIKRAIKPGLGFFAFETAWHALQGDKAMHTSRKGQTHSMEKNDIKTQITFIASLLGASV
jgi:transposase, IS6 family